MEYRSNGTLRDAAAAAAALRRAAVREPQRRAAPVRPRRQALRRHGRRRLRRRPGEPRAESLERGSASSCTIDVDSRKRPVVRSPATGCATPGASPSTRRGNLYIGDVGQNAWEEIDYTPRSSPGLENYGWNVYEGTHHVREQEPEQRRASRDARRRVQPFERLLGHRRLRVEGPLLLRRLLLGPRLVAQDRRAARRRGVREESINVPSLSSWGLDGHGNLYAVSLERQDLPRQLA